jgi:glycosyltransferase involved in cell wall biosynthesis
MKPLFSIILPTYNSASSLQVTLDSLFMQTYTNFEIIFMDGGSKDGTLAVAESYHDVRIKIYSEQDKGVYDAMNKGMQKANGDWLYFIGSDDYLYNKDTLQSIAQKLPTTNNHVIYGNVLIKGDTGWATDGEVYQGKFSFQKLLQSNICHQSMFYRRSFIEQQHLYYDLNYPVSADWDFNIRCREHTHFTHVSDIVAVFNAGGISSATTPEKEPFLLERKIKYAHLYKKYRLTLLQRLWRKIKKMTIQTK